MFCTAITCMDGRIQKPVHAFLEKKFKTPYVDTITEPGPNLILATGKPAYLVESIHSRLKISVDLHQSVGIAIVGHYDCARNPADKKLQTEHTHQAILNLKQTVSHLPIIGLWVDADRHVHELLFE